MCVLFAAPINSSNALLGLICTVSDKYNEYAQQVTDALKKEKFYVDFVKSDETLPKKIR